MNSNKIVYFFLFFLTTLSTFSQENIDSAKQKYTISGTISDSSNNETLIGVNVSILELKTGVTTNEYGFYSITLPKGNYTLQIAYLGFQTIEKKIELSQNTKNNFKLQSAEQQLREVVVSSNKKSTNKSPYTHSGH